MLLWATQGQPNRPSSVCCWYILLSLFLNESPRFWPDRQICAPWLSWAFLTLISRCLSPCIYPRWTPFAKFWTSLTECFHPFEEFLISGVYINSINHLSKLSLRPYASSLIMRSWCGTLSNSFRKSMKTIDTQTPLLRASLTIYGFNKVFHARLFIHEAVLVVWD